MTAIAFNHEGTEIVRLLLDAGADVNAQDNGGTTALMVAARYSRKEDVALLLERGADPAIRDNEGRNAASMTRDSDEELNRLLSQAAKR
jgi:ankyrin repeat protein